MKFYAPFKIGETRSLTKEGFLVCSNVPIARTGEQLYDPREPPFAGLEGIRVGPDGLIHVQRIPEEVFRPETMASFEGKPFVITHPPDGVNPENWSALAQGTFANVHRGQEADGQADLLLADLMVTSPMAIKMIQDDEMREVSCGYDADYEATDTGYIQRNIVGNHVALVPAGRCGARCAIGDKTHDQEGNMSGKFQKFLDALKKLTSEASTEDTSDSTGDDAAASHAARDAAALKAATDAQAETKVAKDRILVVEGELATAQATIARMTADQKAALDAVPTLSWPDVRARVEIVAPGTTIDEKLPAPCPCIVDALEKAFDKDPETVKAVLSGQGKDAIGKLGRAALNSAFVAVSEIVRARNNAPKSLTGVIYVASPAKDGKAVVQMTPDEINKKNREFYK